MSTGPDNGMAGDTVRDAAVRRIRKRRDFWAHLLVYVLVNGFFVVLWAVTTDGTFFWPIFPIFGWGIGVAMQAWDAFFRGDITEADIDREVARMQRH